MIALKRFSYDFQTMVKSKILSNVDFPVSFRLPVVPKDRIASSESLLISSDWSESKIDLSSFPLYGLYAVIVHSGSSTDVGHYYCFARSSDSCNIFQEEAEDSPWILFNDHEVSKSSYKELKKVTSRLPKDSAYVLFYRKHKGEDETIAKARNFSRSKFLGPCLSGKISAGIAEENRRYWHYIENQISPLNRARELADIHAEFRIQDVQSAQCTAICFEDSMRPDFEASFAATKCAYCGDSLDDERKDAHDSNCAYSGFATFWCIRCGIYLPIMERDKHDRECVAN
jgi:ubiquitin carboxyl-terminal hydrolase 35/38